MKAVVIVDQRGIPKGVWLSYALTAKEQEQLRAEAELQKHTFHYMDVGWDADPCPFHIMVEGVFKCTQKSGAQRARRPVRDV